MWLTKFRNHSIKRKLATSLYFGAFLFWLLILIGSFYTIRHEVDELYDGELSLIARVLLTLYASNDIESQVSKNGPLVTAPPFEGNENYENKLLFQIWGNNKALLVRSSNAPETPIALNSDQANLNKFSNRKLFSSNVRVYTLWIPHIPFVVHVGQKLELRSEISTEIVEAFFMMILVIFPLLLFVIYRGITSGLKPLNHIANEITERTPDNLEPLKFTNVPLEVKGITGSLNNLFLRLKNTFTRERQFIADAAHELRTPLAGLKAQAQVALADKSRVEKSLTRIIEGVDRTSRLADQLLSLSRLEADETQINREPVDLNIIIKDVVSDLQSVYDHKNTRFIAELNCEKTVTGDPDMLYRMIRNLIENAIRYSQNDATIELKTYDSGQPVVEIIDNGPGISSESLERIFDRFYRDINTKESGSGLGLSIVKRIAELHNIQLDLTNRNDVSGINVTLKF